MISPAAVWTLARAEMRTIRRLFRFWFFSGAALLLGVVMYVYYWVFHGLLSSYSASIGALSPKYLISQTASWQTAVLAIGVVFLAFDLRARDRRDRVIEVLDSRPYTNAELVLGRFVGSLTMVMAVAFLALMIIQGFGYLALGLGWYVGEPSLWSSVWAYLLLDALPALALYVAFVQAVALVSKNRLVAALAGLGLAVGGIWLSIQLPVHMLPVLAVNGGFTGNISEIAPQLWTAESLVNRMSLAALAAGLLGLAIAAHPRLDDSRRRSWGLGGGGLLAVGVAAMVAMLAGSRAELEMVDSWREAHRARQQDPVVDIEHIRGSVDIRPGGRLALDLEIRSAGAGGSRALFSLNPGLNVDAVEDGAGGAFPFTHRDGLLEIDLGQAPAAGETFDLRLRARGRPDIRFAYLDSTIDFERLNYQDAQVVLLGSLSGVLERRFVALMPGIAWLPRAGGLIGVDDPRHRPRDFFDLDLEVRAPSGWTVAGPGKGEAQGDGVRFRPAAPVPEAALVAGVYDRRTTEVEGVELELLFDRRHLRNLDYFADAREEIEARAAEHFATAREAGLPYPYRQFSLVEVPWTLRGYTGGWRMDTARAPPGMLLIGETSLPTSRFEFAFRNPERFEDREGGLPRAKALGLENFFANDFMGGNVLVGGARNLFLYRTGARGPEALALEALCNNLVNRLVTDGESYFSVHLFDRDMGWTIGSVIQNVVLGQAAGGSLARSIVAGITDRPEVWDFVLDNSLVAMNVEEDPKRAVNALYLKTSALASAILDGAGRERTAAMIANLVRDHEGSTFEAADLERAGQEAGVDLDALVGDFLHDKNLAGFVVSPAELVRLPDDDQGTPQYETRLFVYNGEPTPGLFRLRYAVRTDSGPRWDSSEPALIPGRSAVEFGLVTSTAPGIMLASPYLALNRGEFPVDLPRVDNERIVERDPLRGARPADWLPPWLDEGAGMLIVDDLDAGFSITDDEAGGGGLRLQGGLTGIFAPTIETDQGLPVYQSMFGPPREWSRYTQPRSWGRYRKTTVVGPAGDGGRRVTYTAELPEAGRWRVELHVPSLSPLPAGIGPIRREVRIGSGDGNAARESGGGDGVQVSVNLGLRLGTYDLELQNAGSSRPIDFDAAGAGEGWAVLGDFDLAKGATSVVLSDETTGTAVAADAVRFVRLDNGNGAAAPTGGGIGIQ